MTRPGLPVFLPFKKEPELLDEGKLAVGSSLGFVVSERRVVTTSGSLGCGGGGGSVLGFFVVVLLLEGEEEGFDLGASMRGGVYLPFEVLFEVGGGGGVLVLGGCCGG